MDPLKIFLNVLNAGVSASFFALAVMFLRLIFKKAPKAIFVLLWGLVALRLVCPINIESRLSLLPSAEPFNTEQLQFDSYDALHDSYDIDIVDNQNYSEDVQLRLPGNVGSVSADFVFNYFHWLIGTEIMLIYSAISYIIIRRKVRVSAPLKENIYLCDGIDTPFILGVILPKIYIPSSINEEDAKFVVAHEKAHLKRKDHLWKPLGFLLLSVYWFNPVLWISYILLCKDIELACDEKVIKDMGSEIKKSYSNALINCSVPRKSIAACPLAFGETSVKSRIKSVLNYKKPALWIIIAAVVVSIILAVCFLTNPIERSEIFNAKYETGKCLYSYVITAEKETKTDSNSYAINASGGVYQDYGNGAGEYIGELKESSFTVKELNRLLKNNDKKSVYLGRISKIYEIKNEAKDKNSIDNVFIEKKNGDIVLVNFFTDGNIMNIFELDCVKRFDDESDNEKNDKLDEELAQFIDLCIAEHHIYEKDDFFSIEHKLIGKKKLLNKTTVYLWVVAEGYSSDEENGITLEHGASLPTVITVEKEAEGIMSKGNGGYKLVEYWEPRDGSYYVKDIRSKFPWYMHYKVIDSQNYTDDLFEKIEKDVMEFYGIDYVAFNSIEAYNEKMFGKDLTLSDVITLADKKDELEWADFENFNYVETGSGLYIRQYNIDDMFTFLIGGSGPESKPMYFYLQANDAFDERIDIRKSNVEEFIREHEKNPVVKNLSAGWHVVPVAYMTTTDVYKIFGVPEKADSNYNEALPATIIRNKTEFQSFITKSDDMMISDFSYPDTESFSDIAKLYDEAFFEDSSLILVHTSAPTAQHRYNVEHISKSEGVLSVGITRINPEAGDTVVQDWLAVITVYKDDVLNIDKINARISSVQYEKKETEDATLVRTYVFEDSKEAIKPSISFYNNGMFQFTFSGFSSYIGVGDYTVEKDKIILKTNDGKYIYVFDFVENDENDTIDSTTEDETKLLFNAEQSSDMLWFSDIKDGSVFE